MNRNIQILGKCATIVAFVVSAIVLLPEVAFGKGAVIGYACGDQIPKNSSEPVLSSYPSNDQLDRLTHVIAMDMFPDANGNLRTKHMFDRNENTIWNGIQTDNWLNSLVSRAHARNVKVSIGIAGVGSASSTGNGVGEFISATQPGAHRDTLVAKIVRFVDVHNLDGVDLDWEFPDDTIQWGRYINLLSELKSALPSKRISIALTGDWPDNDPQNIYFGFPSIPKRIWNAADAIHLMTYDIPPSVITPHSSVVASKNTINAWKDFGNQQSPKITAIDKLHMGCAFYGKNGSVNVPYNDSNYPSCSNKGDNATTLAEKVNYCYTNNYGGVFIWELNQDKICDNTPELLNATWGATSAKFITINTQPAPTTNVVQGSISGSLSVAASASPSCTYQWYSHTSDTNTCGTSLGSTGGAQTNTLTIPTNLTAGTYYYFCEIKSGTYILRSNVAKVIVAVPPPPVINGPGTSTTICPATCEPFSATNWQSGYTWNSSSNLTIQGNGSYIYVCAYNNSDGAGWISIKNGNTEVAKKNVWVGPPVVSGIDGPVYCSYRETFWAIVDQSSNPGYYWEFFGNGSIASNNTYPYATVDFYSPNATYCLQVFATNKCGMNYSVKTLYSNFRGPVISYPNPVSDVLTVDIDEIAESSATGDQRQEAPNPACDIRLYDMQGNLLRQQKTKGGTVQFNVSALPDGIYYLHIYDGVSETPEIQQIMVEH